MPVPQSEEVQRYANRLMLAADWALETGEIVAIEVVTFVPDSFIEQLDAGRRAKAEDADKLVRDDGRWVAVYRRRPRGQS